MSGALEAGEKVLHGNSDECYPVNKHDYMKLVSLCMQCNSFVFNNCEYQQLEGQAMGSPLSAVVACIYMKKLQSEHFFDVVPQKTKWLRYLDDVLPIVSLNTDTQAPLNRFNSIKKEPSLQ